MIEDKNEFPDVIYSTEDFKQIMREQTEHIADVVTGKTSIPLEAAHLIFENSVTSTKICVGAITANIEHTPYNDYLLTQAVHKSKRVMELQDEFYLQHPIRRFLKKRGWIPDPDMKARLWALERYEIEERQHD